MAEVRRLRVVFFGSGAFGLPTLKHLSADRDGFDVALVVSQPDKPAGRQQRLTPTPVAQWSAGHGIEVLKPANANEPAVVSQMRALRADAYVVIAFGQKIGSALLAPGDDGIAPLAINLHGSLLPAYRGAAPIQRAMIDGCATTGVSVITLAQRMDAGDILAAESTAVRPDETAGELHDRLAQLGPGAVERVLEAFRDQALSPKPQDESLATLAPKLTKAEGTTGFDMAASRVRARVHGLNPWPGCTVRLDGANMRLLRVRDHGDETHRAEPGMILENLHVACASGAIEVLEVQPEGGRPMPLAAYRNGRAFEPKMQFTPQAAEA